jgi:hypothetical protein
MRRKCQSERHRSITTDTNDLIAAVLETIVLRMWIAPWVG